MGEGRHRVRERERERERWGRETERCGGREREEDRCGGEREGEMGEEDRCREGRRQRCVLSTVHDTPRQAMTSQELVLVSLIE